MASCDLLHSVSHRHLRTRVYSPNAPKANECSPRAWRGTLSIELVEYRPPLDKIWVTTERYDCYRIWWGFWSL